MLYLIILLNFVILLPTYYLNEGSTLVLTLLLIAINIFTFIFHSGIKMKSKGIVLVITIALSMRVILLILNYVVGIPLPQDGLDTEFYHERASNILYDVRNNDIPSLYPIVLGIIYLLTDDNRLFGQFFNIVFFYIGFYYFYKALVILNLKRSLTIFLLVLFAFFPQSLVFSTILLRESMIVSFVTIALYFAIKYISKGNIINIIVSIIFIILASAAHSGMIVLLFSLIIIVMLYSPSLKKFNFSTSNLIKTLFILSIISLILFIFNEMLLSKFLNLDAYQDAYARFNLSSGGSAYLGNITIDSLADIIIFGPLKAFYLLTSPLPFDWRSIVDVLTFFLDSLLYLYGIYLVITNFKLIINNPIGVFLLIGGILFAIVFGYGTHTAGTAIRHRFKIITLILLIIGLVKGAKNHENINYR